MVRKNFFEKAINRKIGGMKRSAKANLKKEAKKSGCLTTLLAIVGWVVIIGIVVVLVFG
jgi:hypothetical protein